VGQSKVLSPATLKFSLKKLEVGSSRAGVTRGPYVAPSCSRFVRASFNFERVCGPSQTEFFELIFELGLFELKEIIGSSVWWWFEGKKLSFANTRDLSSFRA
jgi:hypothetical protein